MSITVRPYQPGDAHDIAELYSRYPDNPNPVPGGISAGHVERELAGRHTAAFFVAVDDEDVVGTFGLFRSTGRRSARDGELIADMFFVAPAYRNGLLTGRLFTEAIEWMIRSRCLVLRLTVNPANAVAFRLYRRVGCVSVGQAIPGEDGNVELYNYIPLILRGVLDDLDQAVLAELGSITAFGGVTGARTDDLRNDVEVVGGVRTVTYRLVLGPFEVTAVVDVDRGTLLRARIAHPDGSGRALRVTQPPYHLEPPKPARSHRFGTGRIFGLVDGSDGTVRVFCAGHVGPLLVSTWPGGRPDRAAGWRESQPCDLEITPIDDGVRIVERIGTGALTSTVTLVDGRLDQRFHSTGPLGRVFQTVGLRRGTFTVHDAGTGATRRHPIGLGLGVRDASELVAAAQRPAAGSELTWDSALVRVRIRVDEHTGVVHSCLLERGLEPGPDGVARLHADFGAPPSPQPAGTPAPAVGPSRRIRADARAGGIVSWLDGSTKVLRSPYPRRRPFAHNPRWSAGMWVTTERDRFSRDSGVGWGVASDTGWEEKEPLRLVAVDQGLDWQVMVPADPAGAVLVDVRAPASAEEVVLWLTPNVVPRGRVTVPDPTGGVWQLDPADVWQIWTREVTVPLPGGRRLHCRPGPGAADDVEIVVRSAPGGLLLGCVAQAGGIEETRNTWQLTVHS
ncbi:GNAT family N-acetyltransferase [Micromonospora sp. NBC_00421]|uniref:GNAT family N-acetyltransferase n=1 Tax=Micromonospora sp. NBC_00421 TaxID=2975976 RepID=UPI002E2513C4